MSRSIYARLARRFGDERRRRERRAFLRAALAAAAAGTLGLPALTACRPASPGEIRRGRGASSRHVIIVGAGLAGLACADALHRAGITITVVEARPRVGGRVSTLRNIPAGGGAIVEAGGEFIGSNHPAWLGMAQRFGLPLRDADDPAATDDGPIIQIGRAHV